MWLKIKDYSVVCGEPCAEGTGCLWLEVEMVGQSLWGEDVPESSFSQLA